MKRYEIVIFILIDNLNALLKEKNILKNKNCIYLPISK